MFSTNEFGLRRSGRRGLGAMAAGMRDLPPVRMVSGQERVFFNINRRGGAIICFLAGQILL